VIKRKVYKRKLRKNSMEKELFERIKEIYYEKGFTEANYRIIDDDSNFTYIHLNGGENELDLDKVMMPNGNESNDFYPITLITWHINKEEIEFQPLGTSMGERKIEYMLEDAEKEREVEKAERIRTKAKKLEGAIDLLPKVLETVSKEGYNIMGV